MPGMTGERRRRRLLQVVGLHKRFGALEVLQGGRSCRAGRRKVAIIGPSGSGKTTLLRCINYLERPTDGPCRDQRRARSARSWSTARWREMSDREIARIRAGIGMVFQRFNLFPHLTALENVMLGPTRC